MSVATKGVLEVALKVGRSVGLMVEKMVVLWAHEKVGEMVAGSVGYLAV